MPFILPARTLEDDSYSIDNSLRMNDADNSYLNFTPGSDGDLDKWTLSMWVKRTIISTYDYTFTVADPSGNNTVIVLYADDGVRFEHYDGSQLGMLTTNRKLRDPSAWYHLVFVWDTSNGTAGNRQRMYINGVEETSFATDTNPSSGRVSFVSDASYVHWIGRGQTQTEANNFDGYLAEVAFCDGQAYAASDFGETDDNGVWIPKKLGVTFGSQGYYLEFKETGTGTDSSGIGADTSGNGNHWAVTNLAATDITTDTPTNNFCTMNPLDKDEVTLAEGNTETLLAGSSYNGIRGTIAIPNSGKWYYEVKVITLDNDDHSYIGFADGNTDLGAIFSDIAGTITYVYDNSGGTSDVYNGSTNVFTNNSTFDAAANDILNVAFDRDNDKVYFGLNGTYAKADGTTGGDPSNGTNPTCTSVAENTAYTFLPAFGGGDNNAKVQFNFGNPPYANSSSVADANGYGAFEYAPPTGFYALCTKNLAEYG